MSRHPHLSSVAFGENETADTYELKAVQLVRATLCYSANQIVKSVDVFNQFTRSLLSYSETFTTGYMRDIIFCVSCASFPEVAIFMLDHGLYTQQTLKTIYKGLNSYPLEEIIYNNNILLMKRFSKLDSFEKLLFIGKQGFEPPLFSTVKNSPMLKCVLESEYCTEGTLKIRHGTHNVFGFVCKYGCYDAVKRLLESEKCTINVIMESYIGDPSANTMSSSCFEPLLKSNKLPNDFFVGRQKFDCSLYNSTLFVNSPYCNVEMVEDFINNCYYKGTNIKHYLNTLKIIFAHEKYSHLTEKYNSDGSVKSNWEQKNEMYTKEYFEEVKDTIEALQCEIQILNLTIGKMELEREMNNLKQTN